MNGIELLCGALLGAVAMYVVGVMPHAQESKEQFSEMLKQVPPRYITGVMIHTLQHEIRFNAYRYLRLALDDLQTFIDSTTSAKEREDAYLRIKELFEACGLQEDSLWCYFVPLIKWNPDYPKEYWPRNIHGECMFAEQMHKKKKEVAFTKRWNVIGKRLRSRRAKHHTRQTNS